MLANVSLAAVAAFCSLFAAPVNKSDRLFAVSVHCNVPYRVAEVDPLNGTKSTLVVSDHAGQTVNIVKVKQKRPILTVTDEQGNPIGIR